MILASVCSHPQVECVLRQQHVEQAQAPHQQEGALAGAVAQQAGQLHLQAALHQETVPGNGWAKAECRGGWAAGWLVGLASSLSRQPCMRRRGQYVGRAHVTKTGSMQTGSWQAQLWAAGQATRRQEGSEQAHGSKRMPGRPHLGQLPNGCCIVLHGLSCGGVELKVCRMQGTLERRLLAVPATSCCAGQYSSTYSMS